MKHRFAKTLLTIAAGVSVGLGAAIPAYADTVYNPGSGGTGGGSGGSGTGPSHYIFVLHDNLGRRANPDQGWGQASTNYFVNRLNAVAGGAMVQKQIHQWADPACNTALQRAIARSGGKAKKARVVGLYMGVRKNKGKWVSYGANGKAYVDNYPGAWNAAKNANTFPGHSAKTINSIYKVGLAEANATAAAHPSGARAVCIALNEFEPEGYELQVATAAQGSPGLAGGAQAVHDQIRTSAKGTSVKESLKASVVLNWDGFYGGKAKAVTKTMNISSIGTANSPEFTPKDFGWTSWAGGKYWYDIKVARQKAMAKAVDTPDRVASETFELKPPPPVKTMHDINGRLLDPKEVVVSAMPYLAKIKAHTAGAASVEISDTILSKNVFIGDKEKDDFSKIYVTDEKGSKVAADIKVDDSQDGKRIVKAVVKDAAPGWFTLNVPTAPKPTKVKENIQNVGKTCWDTERKVCEESEKKEINKEVPDPNKAWVLNKDGSLVWDVNDPQKTNNVGADQKTFNHGDKVGAVVNGHFPANMDDNLDRYVLIDNWAKAAKYVDFTKAHESAKVYVSIAGKWEDKTKFFDFKTEGTKTIATAKEGALKDGGILTAGTKLLKADVAVKLVIEGKFYPVNEQTNTHGDTIKLFNEGAEIYNNEEIETNVPPVFIWNPKPDKDVLGQAGQAGPNTDQSINENKVLPGQKLQYRVGVDMNLPNNTDRAYELKRFDIVDNYDEFFILNKKSIKIVDNRNRSRVIPRSQYKIVFDDAKHSFTISFSKEWMDKEAKNTSHMDKAAANTPDWLTLTFDGKVSDSIAAGTKVKNQAFQVVNDSTTPTNWVTNEVPPTKPLKEDLNEAGEDINGKTVITGDKIVYRVTLDASPLPANADSKNKLAYWVHKLGITDDYDEEYLNLEPSGVKIIQADTGKDVTGEFNIQVKNGKAFAFAKTHDYTNEEGVVIKGDPQPKDLEAYDKAPIKPDQDPIIDQSLMGHKYWVYLHTQVKKSKDGYVIRNQAIQNLENMRQVTNVVHNPLKEINPKKDVVVGIKGDAKSINNSTVKLDGVFAYKLSSSILPAARANKTTQWSITDDYNEKADQYTGQWSVLAERDIFDENGKVVFAKGSTIAKAVNPLAEVFEANGEYLNAKVDLTSGGKVVLKAGQDIKEADTAIFKMGEKSAKVTADVFAGKEKVLPAGSVLNFSDLKKAATSDGKTYFKVTEKGGVITIEAQKDLFDLVNTDKSMASEQGWSAYIGMRRISVGTIKNKHTETYNGVKRDSNEVVTKTPENPAISIVKWDKDSGRNAGDRNDAKDALTVKGNQVIMFTIKNTGDVPLVDVKLADKTVKGSGHIDGIKCPDSLAKGLKVGEEVTCEGNLTGVKPGETHTDIATVTGKSFYSGKQVSASDPWNGKGVAKGGGLAKTGATSMLALLTCLMLAGAGSGVIAYRRKVTM